MGVVELSATGDQSSVKKTIETRHSSRLAAVEILAQKGALRMAAHRTANGCSGFGREQAVKRERARSMDQNQNGKRNRQ
jgi:hypothetical protein